MLDVVTDAGESGYWRHSRHSWCVGAHGTACVLCTVHLRLCTQHTECTSLDSIDMNYVCLRFEFDYQDS